MKSPPAWKIKKMYTCDVTLHKVTTTEIDTGHQDEFEDNPFGQVDQSEKTYSIKAEIQNITLEDMTYLPPGQVKEGDCWGYFLSSYRIEGEDIEIEVNDYITFNSIKYLIERIESYWDGNTEVYRRAFLRREVGQ